MEYFGKLIKNQHISKYSIVAGLNSLSFMPQYEVHKRGDVEQIVLDDIKNG